MAKIDFLAIGDVVIDAFIKLKDASVNCKLNNEACELCLRFGDKVPYESVTVIPAVGNGPNAAVSAARLGLNSALITHIGSDDNGKECLSVLKKDKVNTKYIETQKGKKTNYHYVLWYEVDRTILVKHTDFDYKLPKLPEVSWIYLTSLASNTLPYHEEIAEYLKKNPQTKLAFQPGTFQIKTGAEKLKDLYAHTEIFFCNVEEAETITGLQTKDVLILSRGIKALGPKMVAISDGPNGAYLYHNDELWKVPIYKDIAPPVDRTGAGDAFASTMTVALALGKSPIEALTWGPINSMSVVQEIGAQKGLLSRAKLEEYLSKAPAEYKATKI
jgi:ribokinase